MRLPGLGCWKPAMIASRQWTYFANLGDLPAGGLPLGDVGFTGAIVNLSDGLEFYGEGLTSAEVFGGGRSARAAVGAASLWLAVRCHPGNRVGHLMPYDEDSGWAVLTRNMRWLAQAAQEVGARGILMDGENYSASPGGGGGQQDPAIAWPSHPRAVERAREWLAAVRSVDPRLPFGHFLTWRFAKGLAGYSQFWKAIPGGKLFFEDGFTAGNRDYQALGAEIARTIGAVPVVGIGLAPYSAGSDQVYVTAAYRQILTPMGEAWFYPKTGTRFLLDNPREAAALSAVFAELKGKPGPLLPLPKLKGRGKAAKVPGPIGPGGPPKTPRGATKDRG